MSAAPPAPHLPVVLRVDDIIDISSADAHERRAASPARTLKLRLLDDAHRVLYGVEEQPIAWLHVELERGFEIRLAEWRTLHGMLMLRPSGVRAVGALRERRQTRPEHATSRQARGGGAGRGGAGVGLHLTTATTLASGVYGGGSGGEEEGEEECRTVVESEEAPSLAAAAVHAAEAAVDACCSSSMPLRRRIRAMSPRSTLTVRVRRAFNVALREYNGHPCFTVTLTDIDSDTDSDHYHHRHRHHDDDDERHEATHCEAVGSRTVLARLRETLPPGAHGGEASARWQRALCAHIASALSNARVTLFHNGSTPAIVHVARMDQDDGNDDGGNDGGGNGGG